MYSFISCRRDYAGNSQHLWGWGAIMVSGLPSLQ